MLTGTLSARERMQVESERSQPATLSLVIVLAIAFVTRLAFVSGFFGSDEVTYLIQARNLFDGNWTDTSFLVALRHGFTIPVAFFFHLFGAHESTALVLPMMSSVIEVAVVFMFGTAAMGRRAGMLAALTLALLPLHVNSAGMPTPSATLSLMITLSVVLFLRAENRGKTSDYLLAGLVIGLVFWVKEKAIVYTLFFPIYALVHRRWSNRWCWVGIGAACVIAANGLVYLVRARDYFYKFKLLVPNLHEKYLDVTANYIDAPGYYLKYLFLDGRYSWIVPLLAVAGVVYWIKRHRRKPDNETADAGNIILWLTSLIAVLSVLPISLAPLKFIAKQTNYMIMFAAPLCLVAGYALARLKRPILWVVLGIMAAGSITLSALKQQSIHVFTANAKAAAEFARAHPSATVYGNIHTTNVTAYQNVFLPADSDRVVIHRFSAIPSASVDRIADGRKRDEAEQYVIVDHETLEWAGEADPSPEAADCWNHAGTLKPTFFSTGAAVTRWLEAAAGVLPERVRGPVSRRLAALSRPRPAEVYRILPNCASSIAEAGK